MHKTWTLMIGVSLALGCGSAAAGPCGDQIAQFETTVQQSAKKPDAGPTAVETTAAKLGRQPTPSSVSQAERQAQSSFADVMARARTLDAQGDHAGCTRALAEAKLMFDAQ
jgi:hypothetical protein